MRRCFVGSGYFDTPGKHCAEFFRTWYANTAKIIPASDIHILSVGRSEPASDFGIWIELEGNLGHTHDLTNGRKPYEWCGWSMGFFTLAMLAYCNESDFCYKEQDCLAFGPWLDRMYSDLGNKNCVFGDSKHRDTQACAQSLVLVRHYFIPEFVRLYLGTGDERIKENECELKFARLEKEHPDHFCRLSFGVDRDRPLPFDAEVWYAQHFTESEMLELIGRRLI